MDSTPEAPDMGRTTIQVSDELADELHSRKDRGDSYEDVIWRLIEASDGGK
jgi:predicted CopG family antitoxin